MNEEIFKVPNGDERKMSTEELHAEFIDVEGRLKAGNLAGWLTSRLEDRKLHLALEIATRISKEKKHE